MPEDVSEKTNEKQNLEGTKSPLQETKGKEAECAEYDHAPRRALISQSTCKKISYVTQFLVIAFALSAFCIAVYYSINKLLSRQILEGKESEPTDNAWFKFAICLRPFMTSSSLKELYVIRLNTNFNYYLKTETAQHYWGDKFMLDDTLRPKEYIHYFQSVHPWNDVRIPVSELWRHQMNATWEAFQEFKVNKQSLKTTTVKKDAGMVDGTSTYTVLESVKDRTPNQSDPALLGDYSLSPLYAGCVNITVNRKMSKRQMEIRVKFRNERDQFAALNSSKSKAKNKVTLFEAADLFVYDESEFFTELPIVKRFAKFSIQANSLERLLVKGASYTREKAGKVECVAESGYSQTNCRYWCIMRALLTQIQCSLPWMQNIINKPWMVGDHKDLHACANHQEFLETLQIQHQYLDGTNSTKDVKRCLDHECKDPCKTFKVQLLSLGSKSIGSNYGISLTISPEYDRVQENFDYTFLNMVAELSASISFLLGLSAIAIYDWLIAFGLWAAMKLGMDQFGDPNGDEDGGDAVDLSQSALLRLQVLHEVDEEREASAGARDANASLIWHVEPNLRGAVGRVAPGEQRLRRDSLQLPDDSPGSRPPSAFASEFATPTAGSPQPDPTA